MSTAYCHGCDRASTKSSLEDQPPCPTCGARSYAWSPRPHQKFYALTDADRTFLKLQRIKEADEIDPAGVDGNVK